MGKWPENTKVQLTYYEPVVPSVTHSLKNIYQLLLFSKNCVRLWILSSEGDKQDLCLHGANNVLVLKCRS